LELSASVCTYLLRRAERGSAVSGLERRVSELQHANSTLQREVATAQDEAAARIREVEAARCVCVYVCMRGWVPEEEGEQG
jgi:hypothetical protein